MIQWLKDSFCEWLSESFTESIMLFWVCYFKKKTFVQDKKNTAVCCSEMYKQSLNKYSYFYLIIFLNITYKL